MSSISRIDKLSAQLSKEDASDETKKNEEDLSTSTTTTTTTTTASSSSSSAESLLPYIIDNYNGARIYEISEMKWDTISEFEHALKITLDQFRTDKRRGVWLKLWIPQHATLLKSALNHGFEMHHCQKEYLMLCQWLPPPSKEEPTNMIPGYAHSYMGVHCFVVNRDGDIALVSEKKGPSVSKFKIPGGAVDLHEDITVAGMREVYEETGLKCTCLGTLYVRQRTQFRFGNTMDMSLLLLCVPESDSEKVYSEEELAVNSEIAQVKWFSLDRYFSECSLEFLGKNERDHQCLKESVAWIKDNYDCLDSPKSPPIFWKRYEFEHRSKTLSLLFHP